jgi:hypothetical protein
LAKLTNSSPLWNENYPAWVEFFDDFLVNNGFGTSANLRYKQEVVDANTVIAYWIVEGATATTVEDYQQLVSLTIWSTPTLVDLVSWRDETYNPGVGIAVSSKEVVTVTE